MRILIKVLGLTLLAVLLVSVSYAPAPVQNGAVEFNISIQKDASISISNLCLASGDRLEFKPGINGLDEDDYANAINVCLENETVGEWNLTNIGNIPAYLYLRLNDTLPTGITVAVGNESPYSEAQYVNLTTTDIEWVQSPLEKTGVTKFWERVAADATAQGGDSATLQVVITSYPSAQ